MGNHCPSRPCLWIVSPTLVAWRSPTPTSLWAHTGARNGQRKESSLQEGPSPSHSVSLCCPHDLLSRTRVHTIGREIPLPHSEPQLLCALEPLSGTRHPCSSESLSIFFTPFSWSDRFLLSTAIFYILVFSSPPWDQEPCPIYLCLLHTPGKWPHPGRAPRRICWNEYSCSIGMRN